MSDKNTPPWLQSDTMQNRILREAIYRDEQAKRGSAYPSVPSNVPSLLDIVRAKEQQYSNPQQPYSAPQQQYNPQPMQQYTPPTGPSSLETVMLGTLQAINNSLDKKFLSEGTVFLVCIDRSGVLKPDVDPSKIPTLLSNNPTTDIKIISFQEYTNEQELKSILAQMKPVVEQFQVSNAQNPNASQYHIFLGRLVEKISFNDITFDI